MAVKLFSLKDVSENEAEEVRELLASNGVDYYETPAGSWGISAPAIWLNDKARLTEARSLLDAYQHERAIRIRREYEQLRREGKAETVMDRIKNDPIRFVLYLALALFILYVSIQPFIDFGK
jgi:hypothetical protein